MEVVGMTMDEPGIISCEGNLQKRLVRVDEKARETHGLAVLAE